MGSSPWSGSTSCPPTGYAHEVWSGPTQPGLLLEARRIKQPPELHLMREAIRRVEHGVGTMERAPRSGLTEVDAWAVFHHDLIAMEGATTDPRYGTIGVRRRGRWTFARPSPARLLWN